MNLQRHVARARLAGCCRESTGLMTSRYAEIWVPAGSGIQISLPTVLLQNPSVAVEHGNQLVGPAPCRRDTLNVESLNTVLNLDIAAFRPRRRQRLSETLQSLHYFSALTVIYCCLRSKMWVALSCTCTWRC